MREVAEGTLGQLQEWGWEITWHCQACEKMGRSDIARIIAAKGADYALTNRRAPCRTPGCGWFVQFGAQLGMRRVNLQTSAGEAYWSDRWFAERLADRGR